MIIVGDLNTIILRYLCHFIGVKLFFFISRYENGIVTKVYAVAVDPYWSVNIKRGIISLMNLDLNIENPAPVASDVMQPFMEVISSDYNTMSAKTAYKVIEVKRRNGFLCGSRSSRLSLHSQF